ncbi:ABC-2 type transport system ATP-binding protein [Streptohalobacillus salinus]|uniref:ABC-2 type transport system ATP-binding protein n=1 Tax=Streptohalobacillus salinus TaxID=621096 RepID=A0A2V3W4Z4_9BACI|nr:ABC transporter ATP-binding protein [Streptohalobacillus salinus]PXW89172.1 ABC-2 type transport system ATP-binding protein [Streptohalobacillus salinus]
MALLSIRDLSVKQGETLALDGLNLAINEGELVALIGHNGAGKSTLMKTMMGLLDFSKGEIVLKNYNLSEDPLNYKRRVVYIPEQPFLLTELTVYQHFQLYIDSYQRDEQVLTPVIEHYLQQFEIQDKRDAFPLSLSKGMRQKVQLICGLLIDADLLIIDEPFIGLDVYAQRTLVNVLTDKKACGQTILLTTHQFDQLDTIMDRYVMLHEGKVIEEGSDYQLDALKRRFD